MKIKYLVALGLIGGLLLWQVPTRLTETTEVVTVTKTVPKGENNMVYTDKGAFVLNDTFVYFRHNSSDHWGKLKVNTAYEITHVGFRIGWLSWYENIIEAKEIK